MSVKIMGMVWDADLPPNEKYFLLAYADHADHDGRNIYPAVDRVAWKTGYSDRQVQRVTQKLAADGILVRDGIGPHGTHRWRIDLEKLPKRTIYIPQNGKNRGDILSPQEATGVTSCHPRGDILSGGVTFETVRGDIAMSPEPSFNHQLNHQGTAGGFFLFADAKPMGNNKSVKEIWQMVLSQLQLEMPKVLVDTYLAEARCLVFNCERDMLIVGVENEVSRDWLKSRAANIVDRLLSCLFGQDVKVEFITPEEWERDYCRQESLPVAE